MTSDLKKTGHSGKNHPMMWEDTVMLLTMTTMLWNMVVGKRITHLKGQNYVQNQMTKMTEYKSKFKPSHFVNTT